MVRKYKFHTWYGLIVYDEETKKTEVHSGLTKREALRLGVYIQFEHPTYHYKIIRIYRTYNPHIGEEHEYEEV